MPGVDDPTVESENAQDELGPRLQGNRGNVAIAHERGTPMPVIKPRICGENLHLQAETVGGCGMEIGFDDEYRCLDCGVFFHKECLRRHFEKKVTEEDVDREGGRHAG